MSGLLQGRVAIVTGAGRGIGRAIAESLVAEGAKVIVADNGASIAGDGGDPEVARTAAQEMNDKAGARKALAFTESVASPGVGKQLVDLAVKTFGGIDIVVNNAAILRDAFVFRADPADWDAVIRTNLSSAFYLINAASGVMRDQSKSGRGGKDGYDWGRIVNMGLLGRALRQSRPGRLCQRQGRALRAHARHGDGPRARPDHRQRRGAIRPHPRHRHHPARQRSAKDLQGTRPQDRRAPCREPGDGALFAQGQDDHRPAAGRERTRDYRVQPAAPARKHGR
jgi:Dehydrogenases with different specificities (related to short-chain alcohol dehydrogenases)